MENMANMLTVEIGAVFLDTSSDDCHESYSLEEELLSDVSLSMNKM